jgi:hypothetical protein
MRMFMNWFGIMKAKNFLVVVALVLPMVANASDWLTSTFTVNATYLDLASIVKAPAFSIHGKAVFRKDLYAGHLVINAKAYECSSIGLGGLTSQGENQYICNIDTDQLLQLVKQSADKKTAFSSAANVLAEFFNAHPSGQHTTIPIAFESAHVESASDYTLHYMEVLLSGALA